VTDSAILAVDNLSFRYSAARQRTLHGVHLRLAAGDVIAVLGMSGSGKTTLLNLLGLLWDGEVEADHFVYRDEQSQVYDYRRRCEHDWDRLRRTEFGFVMQSALLLPHLSCRDNVAMPLALAGVPQAERRDRADRLIAQADPTGKLASLAGRRASQVSGGERQRMAVLRAMIHAPRIVFADEPLSNLDPLNADVTLALLQQWMAGAWGGHRARALMIVTHNVAVAWQIATHFALLRNGTVHGGLLSKHAVAGPDHLRQLLMSGPASEATT